MDFPLADFGSVAFTDLGLTVPAGSWRVPPYTDAYEMLATSNALEAIPTPILGTVASAEFTVYYEATGQREATSPAGERRHVN